jgi:predicted ATPase
MGIIKEIKIRNFKSFKKLEVALENFNVIIGANAAGKSNFISIFKFLRDIVNNGLDNAISMQGGSEYLRNINIGPAENFSVEIVCDYINNEDYPVKNGNGLLETKTREVSYFFALEFLKGKTGFKIAADRLCLKYDLLRKKNKTAVTGKKEKIGKGTLTIINRSGELTSEIDIPGHLSLKKEEIFPFVNLIKELSPKGLLLETPLFHIPSGIAEILKGVSIYNFDPGQSKKAIPLSGKTELEEDGSNLALVLKNLLENKSNKKKFANLIKDVLSFVNDLEVEKFSDRSLLFRLKEVYSNNTFLPASLLSDGTINITALILTLYFTKKPLMVIEEPERNIHPYLIAKVLEMMKEVSTHKQIIVTTHNPEVLKYSFPGDILFIARDKEGYSRISRPFKNEQVKIFLKNEMGMDELYTQNLLEL